MSARSVVALSVIALLVAVSSIGVARQMPAFAGVDVTGNFKSSNCGFYSQEGFVVFRASATCPAGTTVHWDVPLEMDFVGVKDVVLFADTTSSSTDVQCRSVSVSPAGVQFSATAFKNLGQVFVTSGIMWDDELMVPAEGTASVMCSIRIPTSPKFTRLKGVWFTH